MFHKKGYLKYTMVIIKISKGSSRKAALMLLSNKYKKNIKKDFEAIKQLAQI